MSKGWNTVTTQPMSDHAYEPVEDDFTLNAAQMEFMINVEVAVDEADRQDNDTFFDALVASDAWQMLFGDMSWDQAYDRYEIMIGRCTDC